MLHATLKQQTSVSDPSLKQLYQHISLRQQSESPCFTCKEREKMYSVSSTHLKQEQFDIDPTLKQQCLHITLKQQ